jgi:hypothetical protein
MTKSVAFVPIFAAITTSFRFLLYPSMSAENLTITSLLSLFSFSGLYVVAYGWLFGMSLWISFFGGKSLPERVH